MSSVADVFHNHAQRDFGASGFREVELEIRTGRHTLYKYDVGHVWQRRMGESRSLFCVTAPRILAGTSLLMVERPGKEELTIALRLRGSPDVLRVDPSRCMDAVLGSDFTYEDLRFWLPVQTLGEPCVSTCDIDGRESLTVAGVRRTNFGVSQRLRVSLDAEHWNVVEAEWRTLVTGDLVRAYRATSHLRRSGIVTPQRVTVDGAAHGYCSEMSLIRIAVGIAIDSTALTEDAFGSIDYLEAMATWRRTAEVV
ncbi:MAG TPA: outer membrane lipoprotein-sorting protein [Gemmatimonadaceae bacterium]|nr:outer membrane lipoprotein-sorting protein [Gemmatimonadaceae bacterium]